MSLRDGVGRVDGSRQVVVWKGEGVDLEIGRRVGVGGSRRMGDVAWVYCVAS
jgi:hypothetical protein